MVARRHHFLPQCYLKGFSRPKKRGKTHQVVVFDRDGKSFTSNILNIAVEQDFNRVEIDGHAPDVFEQIMAAFEGELGPALNRVLQARNLRNAEDRTILFNFLGLIAIRNPRFRETFREFNEQVLNQMMNLVTADKDRWQAQQKKMRERGYITSDSKHVSHEEMRDFVRRKEYRIELNTGFHIASELKGFDAILPTLFKRKWVSLTPPADSSGFITSDHPVCLMFSDPKMRGKFYGPGHGVAGTEIIFPVGRRLAVVGAFELEEDEIELTEENVARVNGAVVAYAERQVYAHDTEFTYSRRDNEKPRRGAELVNDLLFRRARGS
ncbi:DUF4238 domain-containing protein [Bradyrhizobium yuanmingense]|uniref:DUF4238 domain-containing protein n=1 Tax=Bradyrhizobium yuanmingense TaxID=108015 RepID=UPI0023B899D4|nr:DUF4238 domain-containing protein [Bradyrhizobium yuanmingense]MDF0517740.1 DUF4238 domain-containing protein [Bradyrhizobium yuanmingense]